MPTDIQSQQLPGSDLIPRVLLLVSQIDSPAFPLILLERNARQDPLYFYISEVRSLPALKDRPSDPTLLEVERITNVEGGLTRPGYQLHAEAKQLGLLPTQYQGRRPGQVETQH